MKNLFLFFAFFSSIVFSQTWEGNYTGTADVYFYSTGNNYTNRPATLYVTKETDGSLRMTLKANVPNDPFGSTDYYVYTNASLPNGSNYSGQKRDGASKYYINCTISGNQITGTGDKYTVETSGTEIPIYTITFNVEKYSVLNISPSNINVSSSSGNCTFSVTSNGNWSVSDDATWLYVSPTSSSGNRTLTATYSANNTTSQREATITISGQNMTQTVTVTQAATVTDANDFGFSSSFVYKYFLSNNYPNPFNPTTKIFYSVPLETGVKISVYNSLGEEIINLVDEIKSPGNYAIDFHSDQLVSGMYFYRMQAGNFIDTKKMILLK